MTRAGIFGMVLMAAGALWAVDPTITLNRVQQRYPWNGKVDIDYTVENVPAGSEQDYYIRFKVTEHGKTHTLGAIADYSTLVEASNGTYRVTWDSQQEPSEFRFVDKQAVFKGEIVYCEGDRSKVPYGEMYVIIDLSEGASATSYPVSYRRCSYPAAIETFNTTEYKTTKLVLREIQAGAFMMGSPDGEWKGNTFVNNVAFGYETQHQVTLTRNYLISIFPITQAQYAKIMGSNPSRYQTDDVGNLAAERPVETVSYQTIRGSSKGIQRPATFGNTDETSFCGILSAKTGLTFDLPTEAEWEYACRAGTTTSTYAGEMNDSNAASVLSEIAWYGQTISFAVGKKLPNNWCLYDTLGGIWEFCRDRVLNAGTRVYDNPGSEPVADPLRDSGNSIISRGGGWVAVAYQCRAAIRGSDNDTARAAEYYGFRISARTR